jgi:hypothetical protein
MQRISVLIQNINFVFFCTTIWSICLTIGALKQTEITTKWVKSRLQLLWFVFIKKNEIHLTNQKH